MVPVGTDLPCYSYGGLNHPGDHLRFQVFVCRSVKEHYGKACIPDHGRWCRPTPLRSPPVTADPPMTPGNVCSRREVEAVDNSRPWKFKSFPSLPWNLHLSRSSILPSMPLVTLREISRRDQYSEVARQYSLRVIIGGKCPLSLTGGPRETDRNTSSRREKRCA